MKLYIKSDLAIDRMTRDEMDNPSEFNIMNLARRSADNKKKADEQEAIQKRIQEAREREERLYPQAQAAIDEADPSEDRLEILFNLLVPANGHSECMAGECVRAMMRLLYRDYNDGDKFYEGYGIETCGSAAAMLADVIPNLEDKLISIAENGYEGDKYTAKLNEMSEYLVDYLMENPEMFGDAGKDMYDWDGDIWKEYEPRYDYDVYILYDIEEYIEHECISWDDIADWLDQIVSYDCNEDAYVDQWARDAFVIRDLDSEHYELLQEEFERWQDQYLDELSSEYGPVDELDDEEEEEDE